MPDGLNRAWRVIATGWSFTAFGIGGLSLRMIAFPLLTLCVRDPQRRQRLARRLIQRSFAFFIRMAQALGVFSYEIEGEELLRRDGLLVLANHPTLLDVVFLIAHLPNAGCVVKSRLARNPFTRGPVQAAGYVCNDSGPGLVADCIAALRSGSTLVIFPEGTRTRRDEPLQLQRGAANIAVRGDIDVTPVVLHCDPYTLGKGEPWYSVPPRRFRYRIEVRDDIPARTFSGPGEGAALAARRLTDLLTEYFQREASRAEP
jgi:1-acyl-sn-glycerol-3-phosphate acyltransferase